MGMTLKEKRLVRARETLRFANIKSRVNFKKQTLGVKATPKELSRLKKFKQFQGLKLEKLN